MDLYYVFHDTCIVSMKFVSGTYVDEDNAIVFGSSGKHSEECNLSVIFNGQWGPKTIELLFSGVYKVYLQGLYNDFFSEITEAYLSFHEDVIEGRTLIIWSDNCSFDINKISNNISEYSYTFIAADSLKWRIVEE